MSPASRYSWKMLNAPLVALLAWSLAGCDETPPASPAAPQPVAAIEPPGIPKAKGKKFTSPTSEMGLAELREYRRQQREKGKTP